jgi:hypothetical protein
MTFFSFPHFYFFSAEAVSLFYESILFRIIVIIFGVWSWRMGPSLLNFDSRSTAVHILSSPKNLKYCTFQVLQS